MNQNKDEYSTYDLGLASALATTGDYELLRLDKLNPKRVRFIFRFDKNIESTVNKHFGDKLKLPTLSLLNNQKNLKNRIYSDN